jgi:hypothetical protein
MRLKKTAYRELHDLYSSWSNVRVLRLRRESWMENAARMGEKKRPIEDLDLGARIILKRILEKKKLNGVGRIHLAQGRDR